MPDAARDVGDASEVEPVGEGGCVVRPGDGMASIAFARGFFWETLWNHPANAALKAARRTPEILLPGDRVTVPPLRPKVVAAETARRHVFRRRGVPARIRFCLRDGEGRPWADRRYVLEVGERRFDQRTGADGMIDHPAPPSAALARLSFWPAEAGYPEEVSWTLHVGHIDPIETLRGVQARLTNLDFDCRGEEGRAGERTRAAVARFQATHGLEATGDIDDATRAKVLEVYGA